MSKMRIYIAAPYELQHRAGELAMYLIEEGFNLTSGWVKSKDKNLSETDLRIQINATQDLADIRLADIILFYNPEEWGYKGTGGRHFEVGYAYAMGKRIIIAGSRTNIFHFLSGIEYCPSLVPSDILRVILEES